MGDRTTSENSAHDDLETDKQPEKFGEILKSWPKQTFLIIGNEFCERFSYYGMRAVLTLYFVNILNFTSSNASVLFHAFTVIVYSSPIFGSILADGYIGKFWTIFFVSIVYAIGQIVLAFSSVFPSDNSIHPWLDLLGLLIVGIGTGGIKPCVSAFGGDQFPAHYTRMISIFFSIFYFTINAGSLISMFLTPYMRSLSCLGNESCYPLAFGIPAILMIVATLVFMAGSFWYRKVRLRENVIFRVIRTIFKALRNKWTATSSIQPAHWLDYALEGHDCEQSNRCRELHGNCAQRRFLDDIRRLVRVCVMMLPVPMFWALYDQQGSTWVLQAVAMDARVFATWNLLPDQMGVLNAFLILLFIPIFQSGIYPAVERCGFKVTMLRKMAAGGILTALSFFVCGIVQLFVDQSLPIIPNSNEAHLTFINTFPSCSFRVTVDSSPPFVLPEGFGLNEQVLKAHQFTGSAAYSPNITFESSSPNCPKFVANPVLTASHAYHLTLTPSGWMMAPTNLAKPSKGQGDFSMSLDLLIACENIPPAVSWSGCTNASNGGYQGVIGVCRLDDSTHPDTPCDPRSDRRFYQFSRADRIELHDYRSSDDVAIGVTSYEAIDIAPGTYRLYYIDYTIPYTKGSPPTAAQTRFYPFNLPEIRQDRMGGVYTLTVTNRARMVQDVLSTTRTMVAHNKVNILWQVPQYTILTAGEVMFSITGLEFAYKEASPHLKSLVQAIWLFTTAVGDMIVVAIIALNLFSDVATQMFVFGTIMLIVISIFIMLAIFYYEYADYSSKSSSNDMDMMEEKIIDNKDA